MSLDSSLSAVFFPSVAQRKALDLIFVHLHSMITLFKRNTKHDYYYHCNECTIWILENTSSHHGMHNFHFFLFNLFFVLNLFYFSLHSFKSAGKLNWTENELFFFLLVIRVVWGKFGGGLTFHYCIVPYFTCTWFCYLMNSRILS